MNIVVFVKRVPDTESKIRIQHDTASIVEDGLSFVISPNDEYAVEEGLRLREARGGKVTAVSLGGDETLTVLRKALAMGVDEAVLIKDDRKETYDGLRVARILAAAVKARFADSDLLLFGRLSVGADNAQVPAMTAELLGWPQATVVTKLAIEGSAGTAEREIEGAVEKVAFTLPAVVSAQKGLNEPRYETLKGIMAAKKKTIPVVTPAELGLAPEDIAPRVEILGLDDAAGQGGRPDDRRDARGGGPRARPAAARRGQGHLRRSPMIVTYIEIREGKIKKSSLEALGEASRRAAELGLPAAAVVVGAGLDGLASELAAAGAAKVFLLDNPGLAAYAAPAYAAVLADWVKAAAPAAVFFPATAMGKDLAPRLAARLGASMASDCAKVEVRDGRLVFTRPIYAGKAFLRLALSSTPAIATLRPNVFRRAASPAAAAGAAARS